MRFYIGIVGRVALMGMLVPVQTGWAASGRGRSRQGRTASQSAPQAGAAQTAGPPAAVPARSVGRQPSQEHRRKNGQRTLRGASSGANHSASWFRLPWSDVVFARALPQMRTGTPRLAWKGRVGPPKVPAFFSAHRVLVVSLVYERGKVRPMSQRVVPLKRLKRYRRLDGRFLLRGSHHGKRLFQVAFDFPLLGATASYTRRDRMILSKMERGLVSRVRVVVPWDRKADHLVVVDRKGGRSTPIRFPKRSRPAMCRVSGSHGEK